LTNDVKRIRLASRFVFEAPSTLQGSLHVAKRKKAKKGKKK